MDPILLKEKAEALLAELEKHSALDPGVKGLMAALHPLLEASLTCEILSPVEWRSVPGGRQFSEGHLREFGDLEEAYARFKIEVTGGETPALKMFRQSRGEGGI